jgi:hypothetical protein
MENTPLPYGRNNMEKKWYCSQNNCEKWFDSKCPSFATATTSKEKCKKNPKIPVVVEIDDTKAI